MFFQHWGFSCRANGLCHENKGFDQRGEYRSVDMELNSRTFTHTLK